MMKLAILALMAFFLAGCDEQPRKQCQFVSRSIQRTEFDKCMQRLAETRSTQGGNYTTNDDEDLDKSIFHCRVSAEQLASTGCDAIYRDQIRYVE